MMLLRNYDWCDFYFLTQTTARKDKIRFQTNGATKFHLEKSKQKIVGTQTNQENVGHLSYEDLQPCKYNYKCFTSEFYFWTSQSENDISSPVCFSSHFHLLDHKVGRWNETLVNGLQVFNVIGPVCPKTSLERGGHNWRNGDQILELGPESRIFI